MTDPWLSFEDMKTHLGNDYPSLNIIRTQVETITLNLGLMLLANYCFVYCELPRSRQVLCQFHTTASTPLSFKSHDWPTWGLRWKSDAVCLPGFSLPAGCVVESSWSQRVSQLVSIYHPSHSACAKCAIKKRRPGEIFAAFLLELTCSVPWCL